MSVEGIRLAAVHALELDGLSVEDVGTVALVWGVADGRLAESELEAGRLGHASIVLKRHDERVEVRLLRAPEARLAEREACHPLAARLARERHLASGRVEHAEHHRVRLVALHVDAREHLPRAVVASLLGGRGGERDVAQVGGGAVVQQHAAQDAGETEDVLRLEVGAVRVAVDLHGHHVASRLDERRDVEHGRAAGVLGEPRVDAVDPEVEKRLHAAELKQHLAVRPTVGQVEVAAVRADGVVIRAERPVRGQLVPRHLRPASDVVGIDGREEVGLVHVERHAEALAGGADAHCLPGAGDLHHVPCRDVVIGTLKARGAFGRTTAPLEAPRRLAVEQAAARGEFGADRLGLLHAGEASEPGARRQLAERQVLAVLPFPPGGGGWNLSTQRAGQTDAPNGKKSFHRRYYTTNRAECLDLISGRGGGRILTFVRREGCNLPEVDA